MHPKSHVRQTTARLPRRGACGVQLSGDDAGTDRFGVQP